MFIIKWSSNHLNGEGDNWKLQIIAVVRIKEIWLWIVTKIFSQGTYLDINQLYFQQNNLFKV